MLSYEKGCQQIMTNAVLI